MRRGLLIVFTGIDGTGKTTLAHRILDVFLSRGAEAVYVHGRTKLGIARPLASIGNRLFLKDVSTSNDYSENKRVKSSLFAKHPILKRIYEFCIMADATIQLWRRINIPLKSGKIVVCDRYFYDTIASDLTVDMNYTDEETIRKARAIGRLLPYPDVTFVIDVNEAVAMERKDDVRSLQYLEDRRSVYLQLASEFDMMILDGERDEESLLNDCLRRIEIESHI